MRELRTNNPSISSRRMIRENNRSGARYRPESQLMPSPLSLMRFTGKAKEEIANPSSQCWDYCLAKVRGLGLGLSMTKTF